ncbi:MAG: mandelate racemase/muconate lactonizing enzyme family protein [Pseudomonadota bacterium]
MRWCMSGQRSGVSDSARIALIDVWDHRVDFTRGPFAMAHVTVQHVHGRVVCVRGDDGSTGLGEVVFLPWQTAAGRAQCVPAEDTVLGGLIGEPWAALGDVAVRLTQRGGAWRGVALALETAWLDREAAVRGEPLGQVLGGRQQADVPDYLSVSEGSVAALRSRVRGAGSQYAIIQLKLGMGSVANDIHALSAVLDVMTDEQVLLADANGGWSVDEAIDIIAQFDDARIRWEEPCTAYVDNAQVARRSGRHVMVDQCVGDGCAATRAIDEGVVQSLCIKPAALGGLLAARELRDRATRAGLRVRIDGPWCGDIAAAAILHVALGAPPDRLISGCDLREPLALATDLKGLVCVEGGRIAPPAGPGLGAGLNPDALGRPDTSYGV